jgi:hypothetical protein
MTTNMVINDEKKDIIRPLLTQPTHVDTEIIEIGSSSHDQSILSINNQKMNGTYPVSSDDDMFKSATISFEKINYTVGQTTNLKYHHKWKKIFSCCKQTLNKQILFDLSGIFTPGMNAILGM